MATYSFVNVQLTLTGPGATGLNLGYGSGTAREGFTVAMAEDRNVMYIGSDGEPMHSLRANKGALLTIRLEKTSPSNGALSDVYNFQTNPASGGIYHGRNLLTLTDVNRGDNYTMAAAAFRKFPDNNWAEDAGIVEWTFDIGICDPIIGAGIEGLTT